jgi:peptidoglycan/xylan/chitin deacetylase (PgdA/CDA1 family)
VNKKTLKRTIIKNLWPLLYKTRSHLISRPLYSGIGSILMFHRVCPTDKKMRIQGNSGMEVSPRYLEDLIQYLLMLNYEIISLDSVYERLQNRDEGNKFIAFTFDDGYYDNFLHAYPILKKYNIPFTIYVATNYPDGLLTPWWYPLEELILKNEYLEFKEDGQLQKIFCKRLPEKEVAFHNIRALLMGGPYADLLSRVESFFGSFNVDLHKATKGYMLNWEQIKELNREEIVTFGAHTVNHLALNRLSEKNATDEIINSKHRLESELKNKINHFSYPFGSSEEVNEREFSIAKKCGFKTSTTARWGNIFKKHNDHKECLPRIHVSEKRDLYDINLLSLSINGVIPCMVNKFKRVVTI